MRETPPRRVSVRGRAHSWGSFGGQGLREQFSLFLAQPPQLLLAFPAAQPHDSGHLKSSADAPSLPGSPP